MKAETSAWQCFQGDFGRQYQGVVVPLGHLERRLQGASILEAGDTRRIAFSLLLEWLKPQRLCAVEIEELCGAENREGLAAELGSFDAAFVFVATRDIERALNLERTGLLLAADGFLILVRPALQGGHRTRWSSMRRRLIALDFQVLSESTGAVSFLVAGRRTPTAVGRPLPSLDAVPA